MDIDTEINVIKKLIPAATGDKLAYLNQRLTILLKKKEEREKSKQASNPVEEDIIPEEEIQPEPPSLSNQENPKTIKIIKIDNKTLNGLYLNSDGVKDYMNKCVEYVMSSFATG
jgi:hypothetical protein